MKILPSSSWQKSLQIKYSESCWFDITHTRFKGCGARFSPSKTKKNTTKALILAEILIK
jgi:hypothetical protein